MDYLTITRNEIMTEKYLLEIYEQLYSKMPSGRLISKRVRDSIYYYKVEEKTKKAIYLSKKSHRTILQLKQKRWLEESIKVLKENICIQEKVLKKYHNYDGQSIQNRLSRTYADAFLDKYEKQVLQDTEQWKTEAYRKNPYHQEQLRYETTFGLRVRSKSELLIAELLHRYGIHFQYDAEVRVCGMDGRWKTYYADFLMMPEGELFLWEHMGLMSNEAYRNHAFNKIADYFHHGIFMPDNFIITMDGPDGQLDAGAIKRIIEGQILPKFGKDSSGDWH